MDMETGTFIPGAIIDKGHWAVPTATGALSFDSDWIFDDSTEITVCSDIDLTNPIGCNVYHLKVESSANYYSDFVTKGFFLFRFIFTLYSCV